MILEMKRVLAVVVFLVLGGNIICLAAQKDEFPSVLQGFSAALESRSGVNPSVLESVEQLRGKTDAGAGSLTGILRDIYPEFTDALRLASDAPEKGIAALERLSGSNDPFLAAESSYFLSK